jgi:uncharacterized protein (TIGR02300 family)
MSGRRHPRTPPPAATKAIDSGAPTSQVKLRSSISRIANVAKSELGTKRICPTTGKKFYDLNKTPVISPYTGEIVPIAPPVVRGRPDARGNTPATEEADHEKAEDTVSLEEADAEESTGKVKAALPESEDDIDVEDNLDDDDDDSTFIADEEEEDDDVTDIIGDVSSDEET